MPIVNIKSLIILSFVVGTGCLISAAYIPSKALLAQYLLNKSWEKSRAEKTLVRPWPWADTYPVARIKIPGMDMDVVVLSGSNGETLAFAPGHIDQSVLPGNRGNSLISAHKDTYFENLDKLKTGDLIYIERTDGKKFTFKVTGKKIINTQDEQIPLFSVKSKLTLLTCYPLKGGYSDPAKRFAIYADNLNLENTVDSRLKEVYL